MLELEQAKSKTRERSELQLDDLVYDLLRYGSAPLKEFDLLKQLQAMGLFDGLQKAYAKQADLLLFKQHFIIKNCLYRLQQRLWQSRQAYLNISLTEISLLPYPEAITDAGQGQALAEVDQNLAAYYLDWTNFDTSAEQVDALLASFWLRFHAADDLLLAYQTLELEPGAELSEIKQRYKIMAQANHPDKGGDGERFIACRQAYQLLKTALAKA